MVLHDPAAFGRVQLRIPAQLPERGGTGLVCDNLSRALGSEQSAVERTRRGDDRHRRADEPGICAVGSGLPHRQLRLASADRLLAARSPTSATRRTSDHPSRPATTGSRSTLRLATTDTARRRTPRCIWAIDDNEVDWSTRDDAANILDNLIDRHEIKPLVAVMTDFDFDCQGDDASAFAQNLSGQVFPYAQSHYDVSREPSQRAFLGASCGGGAAAAMLINVRARLATGCDQPDPRCRRGAQPSHSARAVRSDGRRR